MDQAKIKDLTEMAKDAAGPQIEKFKGLAKASKPGFDVVAVNWRALVGAGIGLLVAESLIKGKTRKSIGWALFGLGIIGTAPSVAKLIGFDRFFQTAKSEVGGQEGREDQAA